MKRFLLFLLIFAAISMPVFSTEMYGGNIYENGLTSGDTGLQMYTLKVGFKIFKNFNLPENNGDFETKIFFKIDNKGNLITYEIIQPSGSKLYDSRAVEALRKSSPYPAPLNDDILEGGMILTLNSSLIRLVQQLNIDGLESLGGFGTNVVDTPKPGKRFVNPDNIK